MADLKAVQWAEFWIGGKEEFIDRGPLVSAQYWGHEPGWLEPKETAGVETWTCRQVQPRSSGVCLGIIIAMTVIHGGCTINQVQRGGVFLPFLLMRTLYPFQLQLVSSYQGLPWYVRGKACASK